MNSIKNKFYTVTKVNLIVEVQHETTEKSGSKQAHMQRRIFKSHTHAYMDLYCLQNYIYSLVLKVSVTFQINSPKRKILLLEQAEQETREALDPKNLLPMKLKLR